MIPDVVLFEFEIEIIIAVTTLLSNKRFVKYFFDYFKLLFQAIELEANLFFLLPSAMKTVYQAVSISKVQRRDISGALRQRFTEQLKTSLKLAHWND